MYSDHTFNWGELTIPLPWKKPPLSLNDRMHWRQKHRITRHMRTHIAWTLSAGANKRAPLRKGQRLRVELHYQPRDNRRRDTDNMVASLKPICDGIVDAGIVEDDTPEYMIKPEPVIHPANGANNAHMWLQLSVEDD